MPMRTLMRAHMHARRAERARRVRGPRGRMQVPVLRARAHARAPPTTERRGGCPRGCRGASACQTCPRTACSESPTRGCRRCGSGRWPPSRGAATSGTTSRRASRRCLGARPHDNLAHSLPLVEGAQVHVVEKLELLLLRRGQRLARRRRGAAENADGPLVEVDGVLRTRHERRARRELPQVALRRPRVARRRRRQPGRRRRLAHGRARRVGRARARGDDRAAGERAVKWGGRLAALPWALAGPSAPRGSGSAPMPSAAPPETPERTAVLGRCLGTTHGEGGARGNICTSGPPAGGRLVREPFVKK